VTTVIRQRADSEVPAEDAARYIAERVENARVLVVGGPPIPALGARTERFLEAAARAGLTIVGRDDNVGDVEETAVPVVEGLLREQPNVDAIWCFNDYTAVAAGRGLRRRGAPIWSGRVRGVSAGHLHSAYATERADVWYWTCPSGWLGLDFDARTMAPPGYRHFRFHPDGTIESTAYWIEDARYEERPPFPDWVLKVLAGEAVR